MIEMTGTIPMTPELRAVHRLLLRLLGWGPATLMVVAWLLTLVTRLTALDAVSAVVLAMTTGISIASCFVGVWAVLGLSPRRLTLRRAYVAGYASIASGLLLAVLAISVGDRVVGYRAPGFVLAGSFSLLGAAVLATSRRMAANLKAAARTPATRLR